VSGTLPAGLQIGQRWHLVFDCHLPFPIAHLHRIVEDYRAMPLGRRRTGNTPTFRGSSSFPVDFYPGWFVLVVLEDGLVRFHRAISYKENSLHFADSEMEKDNQPHGRHRKAWNHRGCSHVFSVTSWDRKIIMGALQRIEGQAGCKAISSVARHDQHHPSHCTSPSLFLSLSNFPVANVQVVRSLCGRPFHISQLPPTATA